MYVWVLCCGFGYNRKGGRGLKSWILLGESGNGVPSHHVHTVHDKHKAGLESIPAVTGGGQVGGTSWTGFQFITRCFHPPLNFGRVPGPTKTCRILQNPRELNHNHFILLWGCDANLDASLMYFPPLTVSLIHQKAFKRDLKPDKSFTGVIWQRSTTHYLGSESTETRGVASFGDRSVFQVSIFHLFEAISPSKVFRHGTKAWIAFIRKPTIIVY